MVVIKPEKIIKVSTDFLGRLQRGIQIYMIKFKQPRKGFGHHAQLDFSGNPQFTFNPLPA